MSSARTRTPGLISIVTNPSRSPIFARIQPADLPASPLAFRSSRRFCGFSVVSTNAMASLAGQIACPYILSQPRSVPFRALASARHLSGPAARCQKAAEHNAASATGGIPRRRQPRRPAPPAAVAASTEPPPPIFVEGNAFPDLQLPAYEPGPQQQTFDLVIAGAGPSGLAVAARVSAAGFKVLLMDPNPLVSARQLGACAWQMAICSKHRSRTITESCPLSRTDSAGRSGSCVLSFRLPATG